MKEKEKAEREGGRDERGPEELSRFGCMAGGGYLRWAGTEAGALEASLSAPGWQQGLKAAGRKKIWVLEPKSPETRRSLKSFEYKKCDLLLKHSSFLFQLIRQTVLLHWIKVRIKSMQVLHQRKLSKKLNIYCLHLSISPRCHHCNMEYLHRKTL